MTAQELGMHTIAEQHFEIERMNRRISDLEQYLHQQNAEVVRLSEIIKQFDGLKALVKYRYKNGTGGSNMAAFDMRSVAERYARGCANDGDKTPWEYWVVDIEPIECD